MQEYSAQLSGGSAPGKFQYFPAGKISKWHAELL
jgi:hypothetical protein